MSLSKAVDPQTLMPLAEDDPLVLFLATQLHEQEAANASEPAEGDDGDDITAAGQARPSIAHKLDVLSALKALTPEGRIVFICAPL